MTVRLQITGDITVDREITVTQAGKIITFIGSETEVAAPVQQMYTGELLEQAITPISTGTGARQSLREMMDSAGVKTHAHRIVVLGRYVAQKDPNEEFTTAEIKQLYPQAREKIPPNFKRELDAAITSGFIEGVPGKKDTYFITRTGEDQISNGFSSPVRKAKPKTKSPSTKSAPVSAESVSEAVRDLHPVTPDLDGYMNYHKIATKSAKVLWILAYAQINGIEQLSPREIAYIANKLRDKIEPRDINGLTGTSAKNGWVAKDNAANYSLLHKGDEHLKKMAVTDGSD